MAKQETQHEIDNLLADLRSPSLIQAKTAASQAGLVESLALFVVDLVNWQEWDRAWQTADVAEQIALGLNDERLLAEVIFRRAIWHYRRGELQAALTTWQTAQTHFEAVGQVEGVTNCLCNIGILYKDLGRTAEARHYLEEALAAYEKLEHQDGQAACLTNLGLVLRVMGELETAVIHYQTALQLYQELADKEGEAAVLGNLGLTYLGMGQFQEALTHQEQALAINQEIGYRKGKASALGNLGSNYAEIGDYANAKRCYLEALVIDRELDNPLEVATDLLNLAQLYLEIGQMVRAVAYANEANSLYQAGGRQQGVLETTAVLALIYRLLGDAPQAVVHMQQALALAQKLGHRHQEATIWNNFSMLHKDRGTWEEAAACQAKALELYQAVGDQDGQAASLLNLGMIANRLGQPEEGLKLLQIAHKINRETGSREGELLCQAQTAVILQEKGELDEALALQNEALSMAEQLNNPDHIWRITLGRARTHTAMGCYAAAEADLYGAIHTIETLRGGLGHRRLKESFFGGDKVSVYRRLVLLFVRQRQKTAEALVMVERARSRLLLDELAAAPMQLAKQDVKAVLEQERELLGALQDIQRRGEAGQLTRKLEDERQRYSKALEQIWAQMAAWAPMYVSLRRGDLFEYSEFRTLLALN